MPKASKRSRLLKSAARDSTGKLLPNPNRIVKIVTEENSVHSESDIDDDVAANEFITIPVDNVVPNNERDNMTIHEEICDTIEVPENEELFNEIQSKLNHISTLNNGELLILFSVVCLSKDAAATVYVYDVVKCRNIELNERLWQLLETVEKDRGKTPASYTVPAPQGKTLTPSRRIHKICKGPRMSQRSADSKVHLEAAKLWVAEQPEGSLDASGGGRFKVAKRLAAHLKIDMNTARGVVTALKRAKAL